MPKVSEEHMEARRGQIIAAAVACFAEKGFHKTSMKDICEKANLSPGAVYNYFDSKDDIIEAVTQGSLYETRHIFEEARIVGHSLHTQAGLAFGGFKKMLKGVDRDRWLRADVMFTAEALTNPRLETMGRENYRIIMENLVDMARQWQKKGWTNPELSPEAVAQVMFSCVQGLQLQLIINPQLDLDAYFSSVKSLFYGDFNKE